VNISQSEEERKQMESQLAVLRETELIVEMEEEDIDDGTQYTEVISFCRFRTLFFLFLPI
jgi:hypothetical protein